MSGGRPPLPLPEAVGFPRAGSETLLSGLRLLAVPRRSVPFVTIHLVLRAGSEHDPPERPGLAALSAEMLEAGAGSMDYPEIARRLDALGTTLSIGTTVDGSVISLSFLSGSLEKVLQLVAELVSRPTFPENEFDRRRTKRLHQILQQADRPAALAQRIFARTLYGPGHPYGTEFPGTEGSLREMTRDEVVAFAARHHTPGRAALIAVGDVELPGLARLARDVFSRWETGPRVPDPGFQTRAGQPGTVYFVHRPGSAQSEVRIGRPAISRRDADVFPSIVLNRVFGGQFTSRLNAVLREQNGLTYGIRSSFSYTRGAGPFLVATSVDTARTAEAIEAIEGELQKVSAGGVTQEELELAKRGIAGGFALALEHPSQVASLLDTTVLHDLPEDYYDTYLARVQAVTGEDASGCAGRWMDPGATTTVVVGDAGVLRQKSSPSLRERLREWSESPEVQAQSSE